MSPTSEIMPCALTLSRLVGEPTAVPNVCRKACEAPTSRRADELPLPKVSEHLPLVFFLFPRPDQGSPLISQEATLDRRSPRFTPVSKLRSRTQRTHRRVSRPMKRCPRTWTLRPLPTPSRSFGQERRRSRLWGGSLKRWSRSRLSWPGLRRPELGFGSCALELRFLEQAGGFLVRRGQPRLDGPRAIDVHPDNGFQCHPSASASC